MNRAPFSAQRIPLPAVAARFAALAVLAVLSGTVSSAQTLGFASFHSTAGWADGNESGKNASGAHAAMARDIGRVLADPILAGGIDGVVVASVRTGDTLFVRNPDTLLVPASNRKLFTAAAALALLGPDYREDTDVLACPAASSSPADPGSVAELTLRGEGDPLLSVDDIDALADAVYARGIRHVGSVVADASAFDNEGDPWGDGWQADSLLAYYSPEISALEVNEGICVIALHGGAKSADPTTFTAAPTTSYYTVIDDVTTGAPGSAVDFTLDRSLTGTTITATGSIPPNSSPDPNDDDTDGRITLPSPALYAATLFTERLRVDGAVVDAAPMLGKTPSGSTVIAQHASIPLSDLLGKMLKPSDNLVAECLTRLEAVKACGSATYAQGAALEDKWLRSVGIGPQTHLFADGSGESRVDFTTPRAVVDLLLVMARRRDFPLFYNALSIVGVDGTAKDRMTGTFAAGGNAHVKTGTVRNCRSLSGYVTDRSGEMFAFSILMNNHLLSAHALGQIQDRIVERIAAER